MYYKLIRLQFYDGERSEQLDDVKEEYILEPGIQTTLNRSKDTSTTDIILRSELASKQHAVILNSHNKIIKIQDLGSLNGTFVNGKLIEPKQWVTLKSNDVIGLGIGYLESDTTGKKLNPYVFELFEGGRKFSGRPQFSSLSDIILLSDSDSSNDVPENPFLNRHRHDGSSVEDGVVVSKTNEACKNVDITSYQNRDNRDSNFVLDKRKFSSACNDTSIVTSEDDQVLSRRLLGKNCVKKQFKKKPNPRKNTKKQKPPSDEIDIKSRDLNVPIKNKREAAVRNQKNANEQSQNSKKSQKMNDNVQVKEEKNPSVKNRLNSKVSETFPNDSSKPKMKTIPRRETLATRKRNQNSSSDHMDLDPKIKLTQKETRERINESYSHKRKLSISSEEQIVPNKKVSNNYNNNNTSKESLNNRNDSDFYLDITKKTSLTKASEPKSDDSCSRNNKDSEKIKKKENNHSLLNNVMELFDSDSGNSEYNNTVITRKATDGKTTEINDIFRNIPDIQCDIDEIEPNIDDSKMNPVDDSANDRVKSNYVANLLAGDVIEIPTNVSNEIPNSTQDLLGMLSDSTDIDKDSNFLTSKQGDCFKEPNAIFSFCHTKTTSRNTKKQKALSEVEDKIETFSHVEDRIAQMFNFEERNEEMELESDCPNSTQDLRDILSENLSQDIEALKTKDITKTHKLKKVCTKISTSSKRTHEKNFKNPPVSQKVNALRKNKNLEISSTSSNTTMSHVNTASKDDVYSQVYLNRPLIMQIEDETGVDVDKDAMSNSSTTAPKNILIDSKLSNKKKFFKHPELAHNSSFNCEASKDFFKKPRNSRNKANQNTKALNTRAYQTIDKPIPKESSTKKQLKSKENISTNDITPVAKLLFDEDCDVSEPIEFDDSNMSHSNSQLFSQYSITEDDVIVISDEEDDEILFKNIELLDVKTEIKSEVEDEEQDNGLLELSMVGFEDSCPLIICDGAEIEEENGDRFESSKWNEVLFEDEEEENEDQQENTVAKSNHIEIEANVPNKYDNFENVFVNSENVKDLSTVTENIKKKHSDLYKKVEIIDPHIIDKPKSHRNKQMSEIEERNKRSFAYYTRPPDRSPNFSNSMFNISKSNSNRDYIDSPGVKTCSFNKTTKAIMKDTRKQKGILKSGMSKEHKSLSKKLLFSNEAKQIRFDHEQTTGCISKDQSELVALSDEPSLFKMAEKEKHVFAKMYKSLNNNHSQCLGDNFYVLCWLCNWLVEQLRYIDPPPNIYKRTPIDQIKSLKIYYNDMFEFYETIEPLLYCQIWHSISTVHEKYSRVDANSRNSKSILLKFDSIELLSTNITSHSSNKIVFNLKCSTIKPLKFDRLQTRQLIKINLNPELLEKKEYFAYVVNIERPPASTVITLNLVSDKDLIKTCNNKNVLIENMTRGDEVDVEVWKHLIRGARTDVGSISKIFLNPYHVHEPPSINASQCVQKHNPELSFGQRLIVSNVVDVCLNGNRKLLLIDAVYGTGKTTAIVKGIAEVLMSTSDDSLRFLVLGANAGSLDAVSMELIKFRTSLHSESEKKKFKFLRLDDSESLPVSVYTSKCFIKNSLKQHKEQIQDPIKLQSEIQRMDYEKGKCEPYSQKYNFLSAAILELLNFKNKKIFGPSYLSYYCESRKDIFISNAHIVALPFRELKDLSTVGYLNRVQKYTKTVCIIEDANQCTDLELSLILQLKIDKLILVGNSTCEVVLPFNKLYERSFHLNLFRRLIMAKQNGRKIPILNLNNIFRGNCYPLKSNIKKVLNISESTEHNRRTSEYRGNNTNVMEWCFITHDYEQRFVEGKRPRRHCTEEAIIVWGIAKELMTNYPNLSLVILTPFDIQKSNLINIANENARNQSNVTIVPEIFTVPEFMGREADIVLFSTTSPYVLTKNILQMAFTRAKLSLIIVGHFTNEPMEYLNPESQFMSSKEVWKRVRDISRSSRAHRHIKKTHNLEDERALMNLVLKRPIY